MLHDDTRHLLRSRTFLNSASAEREVCDRSEQDKEYF